MPDRRLASFDRLMRSFVAAHDVPGAALAVSRGGRLVYARGFGFADPKTKEPVQPDSLFRIASISKPITAAAVLRLADQGRLRLDERVFPLLDVEPHLEEGKSPDPRLGEITVLHLLRHTGGWDRSKSFDPMVMESARIARALGSEPPASAGQIIRYMAGRPLDFAPGERYAYSNFGYCLLGRVIEKVTGRPYEEAVRLEVFAPLGIRKPRLGKTLPEGRAPGEVTYDTRDGRTAPAVVGEKIGEPVPMPYGAWYLEAMDAHGGWVASAPDLVRFAAAFDDPKLSPLMSEEAVGVMFARPEGSAGYEADGTPKETYYGCGWQVVAAGEKGEQNHFHTGSLDGTSTILVRRADGLNWAVLFNRRNGRGRKALASLIDPLVHEAADEVKEWPEEDLFGRYL
ncbi:MAG TPA: serine hydrolase domain-containing protein [Gemmataceae bacterium]